MLHFFNVLLICDMGLFNLMPWVIFCPQKLGLNFFFFLISIRGLLITTIQWWLVPKPNNYKYVNTIHPIQGPNAPTILKRKRRHRETYSVIDMEQSHIELGIKPTGKHGLTCIHIIIRGIQSGICPWFFV